MRALLAAIAVAFLLVPAAADAKTTRKLTITVRSSPRADLVSDGDALVSISVPKGAGKVRVKAGPRRVVTKFFAVRADGAFEGIVPGLKLGRTSITATAKHAIGAKLIVTNHPNGGPLFSGPQIQPWTCQKGAVNTQCDQPPTYKLMYRSNNPLKADLQPYDADHPATDVATTTTDQGVKVPFIVRQETGYQDRDQYKILTLYEPGKEWTRWAPQKVWNHKVLITHGGNCGGDYAPGNPPLNDLSGTIPSVPIVTPSYIAALAKGFGVVSTALDNTGHNCNVAVEAESLIMAKERVIERYGDIRYTIGTGCSGGSIAQQTIANAYPGGVYDGLVITCAYPDTMSAGVQFADDHLLRLYFENGETVGRGWTPAQWGLVEGRPDPVNAIVADEGLFKPALSPFGDCVPAAQAYNPTSNPGGTRCGILDYLMTLLGPRPQASWSAQEVKAGRGFAGVPFGNVGVQYGLEQVNHGLITPSMFVDLNARIGGLDIDLNQVPQRLDGDDAAVANVYRTGMINEMDNMSGVAILDHAGPDPGIAHDYAHTWWIRDRLDRVQGGHANHVLWFGPEPLVGDLGWPTEALFAVDKWLGAVERDSSAKSRAQKLAADKPKDLVDRCLVDLCKQGLATRYATPRQESGESEFNDIVKCQLKPLVRTDYQVAFSDPEWSQLQSIFPTGVCDWSKPGVGQQPVKPWQTYSDAKGKVVYGGRPLGAAPRSHALKHP